MLLTFHFSANPGGLPASLAMFSFPSGSLAPVHSSRPRRRSAVADLRARSTRLDAGSPPVPCGRAPRVVSPHLTTPGVALWDAPQGARRGTETNRPRPRHSLPLGQPPLPSSLANAPRPGLDGRRGEDPYASQRHPPVPRPAPAGWPLLYGHNQPGAGNDRPAPPDRSPIGCARGPKGPARCALKPNR